MYHIKFDRKKEYLDLHYTKTEEDAASKILSGRFHIMKHMNMAPDSVRRMESGAADPKEMLKASDPKAAGECAIKRISGTCGTALERRHYHSGRNGNGLLRIPSLIH